ncbi:O-antigen ligase family protein [Geomonas oryzae]|uniref:O-antigen ligase family protein n=1 Tax=Geomonas oryzae TaxID=2364273 RepID=UPI00100B9826|nr:O-antigen ligase family protein [Geomonas oryzae]
MSLRRKPLVAFLVFLSLVAAIFLSGAREGKAVGDELIDALRLLRIIILSVMCTMALLAYLLKSKRASASASLFFFAIYGLLAMLSGTYSLFPMLSMYKAFEVITFVALGLAVGAYLHTWRDIEDAVNIVLVSVWYLVLSASVGIALAHKEALGNPLVDNSFTFTFGGVFPAINPNSLTQFSGILAVCVISWLFTQQRHNSYIGLSIILCVSITTMILAHSRTSLFAFIAATTLVVITYRKILLAASFITLGAFMTLVLPLCDFLMSYFMRGQSSEHFTSLTGRTLFWPLVLDQVYKSPIVGHGFYASQFMLFGVPSVDNTYLEVLLGLGIIGLAAFSIVVASVTYNIWLSRHKACTGSLEHRLIWTEIAVIFIFLFFRSLTGPSFQNLNFNLTIFVFVMVCASAIRRIVVHQ